MKAGWWSSAQQLPPTLLGRSWHAVTCTKCNHTGTQQDAIRFVDMLVWPPSTLTCQQRADGQEHLRHKTHNTEMHQNGVADVCGGEAAPGSRCMQHMRTPAFMNALQHAASQAPYNQMRANWPKNRGLPC
jgi:hypothetical protein